jgi:uroporphyrinogen-III synthase
MRNRKTRNIIIYLLYLLEMKSILIVLAHIVAIAASSVAAFSLQHRSISSSQSHRPSRIISQLRSSPSPSPSSSTTSTQSDTFTVTIALTREDGKNDKLQEAIMKHPTRKILENSMNLKLIEMPCIQHADGPGLDAFRKLAQDDPSFAKYDYVIITSPESASVFGSVVKPDSFTSKIAAVGKATKDALSKQGFQVDFVPSKADGETLGDELPPLRKMGLNNILYSASVKAANTIQDKLQKRKDASFRVHRLNTYDTVPVIFTKEQLTTAMDDVQVACFGSPTAVDAWIGNIDRALGIQDLDEEERKRTPGSNGNAIAVCIGTTTAKRCLESGRWLAQDIYYPVKNPGLEGWVDSCFTAFGDVMERSFWSTGEF